MTPKLIAHFWVVEDTCGGHKYYIFEGKSKPTRKSITALGPIPGCLHVSSEAAKHTRKLYLRHLRVRRRAKDHLVEVLPMYIAFV